MGCFGRWAGEWWMGAVCGCALVGVLLLGGCSRPGGAELEVLASEPATGVWRGPGEVGAGAAEYAEERGVVLIRRERLGGGLVETRVLLEDGQEKPLVESRYVAGEDGSLALAEEINHEERVEVVFDPPLVVLPAMLAGGEPFRQNLKMTVHPLGNRARVKNRGPVKQEIRYEADERIHVPAGEFDAAKLTSIFNAVLAPAEVRNTTEEWLARGESGAVMMIAERREQVTRVLLLPTTTRRTLVLREGVDGE